MDAEHRTVKSASTAVLMGDFNQLIGEQNHLILNALPQQAELRITAERNEIRTLRRQEAEEADRWSQAGGDDAQQGRSPCH